MVIYITLLVLKDWIARYPEPRLEQEPTSNLLRPYDCLFDTTIAYHVTPYRSNYCTYHPLAPLLHSALLFPLTLSAPDDPFLKMIALMTPIPHSPTISPCVISSTTSSATGPFNYTFKGPRWRPILLFRRIASTIESSRSMSSTCRLHRSHVSAWQGY